MSSVQLWESPCGRVVAEWNKAPPEWRVYIWRGSVPDYNRHPEIHQYYSEQAAKRAAKRYARKLNEETGR